MSSPKKTLVQWIQTRKEAPQGSTEPHPHRVDLLRNQRQDLALGPFDGKVAAYAELGAQHYFITTNTDYVPALPSLELPHRVYLRSDMRYGTDDPTLWPQQWTDRYCHMPLISKKGARAELECLWWTPAVYDFVVGSAVTRGLGQLKYTQLLPLKLVINKLLDALYEYLTVYKPRMTTYSTASVPAVAEFVGAFTTSPGVAQQLWAAGVPFWFLRPIEVFDRENILKVVPLLEPNLGLPDANAHGAGTPPVLYSGNSTIEKIGAIHAAVLYTPWYQDPFEMGFTPAPPPSAAAPVVPVANSSRSVPPPSVSRNQPQQPPQRHYKPYPSQNSPKAPPKNDAKAQRDKFSRLDIPEMPPAIVSMATALAAVDCGIVPFPSADADADRCYILPEPALLVSANPEHRRNKFLHHWNLLSDGFIYMLTTRPQPLRPQEWRDILEGLLQPRGAAGSRTQKRSAQLQDLIRPALEASNGVISNFPVPAESVPDFSLARTREIVWQVAETNSRFEFASLDRWVSGQERVEEVKWCFAGHMLIGAPLEMSQRGWVSTSVEERHRYVARTVKLMLSWRTKSLRPDIVPRVAESRQWSPAEMDALENAVCRYYAQAFCINIAQTA
ncbi:hypothetical protein B0H16DRAFT_1569532 [Mycena metata]|uniref:Uncharacterized protein n=1 Tax=Mycena metata TaxID=1033252 RepID=A0AAD7ICY2_9AGAR|nr:hypothetical protein B0H16DRAFT_1569532 [Mycena metata]